MSSFKNYQVFEHCSMSTLKVHRLADDLVSLYRLDDHKVLQIYFIADRETAK